MKKILFSLVLSLSLLCSCSSDPEIGDVYVVTQDFPACDNTMHAAEIDECIKVHDHETPMRMYYLGHADLVEKGTSLKILDKKYDYVCFKMHGEYRWTKKKYLKKYAKKNK